MTRAPVCSVQVDKHQDPHSAAIAVCVEAYKSWLSSEARTDDITAIVIEVTLGKGLSCAAPPPPPLPVTMKVQRFRAHSSLYYIFCWMLSASETRGVRKYKK